MDESDSIRFNLEDAVAVLEDGRGHFEDLVTSNKDNLIERLFSLNEGALRSIVFERAWGSV